MPRRVPFNRVDTAIYHVDLPPDLWTAHLEVRVGGRLDAGRLAAAAVEAVQRHPMVRARMESFGPLTRTFHWLVEDAVAEVPLEVVDCTTDADVNAARDRLLNRRIDVQASPPFALLLAHHPKGDYLIANLSHVVGDGASVFRLMLSICLAYTGSDDPQPALDFARVRQLDRLVRIRKLADVRTRLRALARHVSDTRQGASVSMAVSGGVEGAGKVGVHMVRFDRDETERIDAGRVKPATMNDLLLGALAVTIRRFNDRREGAPGRISLLMPVSLRPAEWRHEMISNIVAMVPVSVPECAQNDLVSAQTAVAERTELLKHQRGLAGAIINMFATFSMFPARMRIAAVRWSRDTQRMPISDTGALTYLGDLPPLDFGPGAGLTTEMFGSGPACMPIGAYVAAIKMNGELFLAMRYSSAQFDAESAEQFAVELRQVLLA